MVFLIDGYNLLHAMGILKGKISRPLQLQKARLGLLGMLSATYGNDAGDITVVFDAAHAPPGIAEASEYKGIHIRWAVQEDSADDLIASIIRHSSAPTQLTVVSDDRQIQQAAERRRCNVLGCADYLEWLQRHRRERRESDRSEAVKPERPSEEESQYWLRQFAELDDSPEIKNLSDPAEWKDIDTDSHL